MLTQIKGFGNKYFISRDAEIWNIQTGKKKKPVVDNHTGYYKMLLWENNKHKSEYLHRQLAISFIPNPENKSEINHKNGNKLDNRLENLEWVTRKENVNHFLDVLQKNIGSNHANYKGAIHLEYGIFCTAQEAADMYGISKRQMLRYLGGIKPNPTKFTWS